MATAPPQKLIVLLAFDKGEDGELIPAFEAREMRDEGTAVRTTKEMARRHVGVITWSRTADLVNREFGEGTRKKPAHLAARGHLIGIYR